MKGLTVLFVVLALFMAGERGAGSGELTENKDIQELKSTTAEAAVKINAAVNLARKGTKEAIPLITSLLEIEPDLTRKAAYVDALRMLSARNSMNIVKKYFKNSNDVLREAVLLYMVSFSIDDESGEIYDELINWALRKNGKTHFFFAINDGKLHKKIDDELLRIVGDEKETFLARSRALYVLVEHCNYDILPYQETLKKWVKNGSEEEKEYTVTRLIPCVKGKVISDETFFKYKEAFLPVVMELMDDKSPVIQKNIEMRMQYMKEREATIGRKN